MSDRKQRMLEAQYAIQQQGQTLRNYASTLSARQRREQDLADKQRRLEEESLNKRVADALEQTEYRPKPFGGDGYEQFNQLKQVEEELQLKQQEEPVSHEQNNGTDPEVPQYLRDPRDNKPNIDFRDSLKIKPERFVPDTNKVSVAEEDKSKDGMYRRNASGEWKNVVDEEPQDNSEGSAETLRQSAATAALNAIRVAQEATFDIPKTVALQEFKEALNSKGDPTHANFWGDVWAGMLDALRNQAGYGSNTDKAAYDILNRNNRANQISKEWDKNAVGTGAIKKNILEVGADAGEIDKYKELLNRGVDMQRYCENAEQILDLQDKLTQIQQLPNSKQKNQLMKDVMNRINQLRQETGEIWRAAKNAATYYDKSPGASVYASPGAAASMKAKPIGPSADLDEINRIINENGYENLTSDQREIISKRIQSINDAVREVKIEYENELPKLLTRMADNVKELKSWSASDYKPSEEFTRKADAVTEFNFTDPNTYVYGLPGLIGSSMSFGGYQVASTALGLTAAAIGTFASGGLATPFLIGASAASTGLGITGGHYENDSEVSDNYMQVFTKKLVDNDLYKQWLKEGREALGKKDASQEEVMWAMATGIYEPKEKIKQLAEQATYGLNNLYKNDMVAVVGDEIFQAGINFLGPITKIAKASRVTPGAKTARFQRMRRFLEEHPGSEKIINPVKNFSKNFADSEFGTAIGSSIAFPLGVVTKAAQAGIKTAIPKSAARLLNRKLGFIADIVERMPSTATTSAVLAKNLASYAGKVLGSGWSEAIEEGKQYLNGKRYAEGAYAGASDTLMDSILNDIAGGARSAYSFVGDMFGASVDKELIANMKGGFLGGFGHTALISGVNLASDTFQDLRANDFVVNNVMAEKLADRTTISNNAYLATQTSPRQYERIMNAFDNMEQIAATAEERNGGTEGLNITLQDVKDQRKAYQEVFDFANRESVHDAAKSLGITPGSKDYGTFVGLAMWAKSLSRDALAAKNELGKKERQIISSWISGVENDERGLSQIFDSMTYEDVLRMKDELGLPDTGYIESESMDEDGGVTISTNLAKLRTYASRAANITKYLANLDALLTLRDQLEQRENPTKADKRRLSSVKRLIQRLRDSQSNEMLKNIETAQDMQKFVVDTKVHEVLRDLYRDDANYTVDLEEGVAMEYMLLGKGMSGVQFLTDGRMQQALDDVSEAIKDRKSGAEKLINQYNYSIRQDEELQQQIHDIFEQQLQEEQNTAEDIEVEPEVQPAEETAETPVEPVSEPAEPTETAEPTVTPEVAEEAVVEPENETFEEPVVNDTDVDEQVQQAELEYAPTTNTMFTADDINTDFGISQEDWKKVSPSTLERIAELQKKIETFIAKWNGKPLSKRQYSGVRTNAIRLQRLFNELRDTCLEEIQQYDNDHNKPVTYRDLITDDAVWEQLHPERLIEVRVNAQFELQVEIARNLWNRFINRAFGTISEEDLAAIQQALSNAQEILASVEDIDGIFITGVDNFERLKFDVTQYLASVDRELPPPPPNITPATQEPAGKPWWHYNTTHTGNGKYRGYNVEDSVAFDDRSIRFLDVSANPDFVQNSVIWFTLLDQPGRSPKIMMNVIYNNHQFTPIAIHTAETDEGKNFYRDLVEKIKHANATGQFVMPQKGSIHRSNGIIQDGPLISMEMAGFLNDDNMYELAYSGSQDTLCLVKYEKGAYGEEVPVAVIPGQGSERSVRKVYEYSPVRGLNESKPADGGIVMMVHPPYPSAENDERVPINLHYTRITKEDAQLIVDLLSGKYCSDTNDYGIHAMENQEFTEDGIGKGLSRMQVLRLLINYKSSQEPMSPYDKQHIYVEYDQNDQRNVILHGNFGEGVEIPRGGIFDITNEAQRNELRDFLAAHYNHNFSQSELLKCHVAEGTESVKHPLHGLVKFAEGVYGKQMLRNGGRIQFGNSSIWFDQKDFGDNQHPKGVSGIVWGMRRGYLLVKFQGFTNTLLNFDTSIPTVYSGEQQAKPAEQTKQEVPAKPEEPTVDEVLNDVQIPDDGVQSIEDLIYDEPLIPGDRFYGKKAEKKMDTDKLARFIKTVLGDDFDDVEVIDDLEKIVGAGAGCLGMCHYTGKLLFDTYAPQGVMYHEAFHKLVELVLGNKSRLMLYKAYAKKMHIKYSNDEELLKNKVITEGLAEEFRYYMENRPAIKLAALKHPFRTLKSICEFMHKIGDFRLYTFYCLGRLGILKKMYKITPEKHQRFLEHLGVFAPFKVGGHEFEHILNRYQYRQLRKTLVMLVFSTNNIGISGENIENLNISKEDIKGNKYYLGMMNTSAPGKQALEELVDNLEYVEEDIKSYIASTFDINRNKHEDEENIEEIEGGENATGVSIGQHIRGANEFSQFSRVSQKVKFMFARIPKIRYAYDGKNKVKKAVPNGEGLLEFYDAKYVFNVLVNRCHDCRNSKELLSRLEKLSEDDAMISYVYNNVIKVLHENALKGNADAEAVFAQMLVALHAAKGEYIVAKASRSTNGTWSVEIKRSDSDYNAREYKRIWSTMFATGAEYLEKTPDGYKMKFMKGTTERYSPEEFHNIYMFFNNIRQAVQKEDGVVDISYTQNRKVEKSQFKVNDPADFNRIKYEFCNTLAKLGINFTKEELDYMLQLTYESSDRKALSKLFERNDKTSFVPFLDWINGCYNQVTKDLNITKNGTLNGRPIETAIGEFGFVGLLTDWKYKYSHDHDQLSVLATKGNRYYVISENNIITDITDDINAYVDGDETAVNDLTSFCYNYIPRGKTGIGSYVLQQIKSSKKKVTLKTVAGFKTDTKGDLGMDYAEISPMEDYVTKMQMLLDGNLIFPTMSDKKTYMCLAGLDIPWLNFIGQFKDLGEGKYTLSQSKDILDQLREYAYCEKATVEQTMRQVKTLDETEKVANFHKGGEYNGHTIVQGARFGSLTGIYDDNGEWVSFNMIHKPNSDVYVDERENWNTACLYFFGIPAGQPGMYYIKTKANDPNNSSARLVNTLELIDHQKKLLSRSLLKQLERELEYAANIGLIERASYDKNVPVVLQYKNKYIDQLLIDSIARSFSGMSDEQAKSLAVATVLSRVSTSSIISLQEIERLYAGHPAFFKWKYGKNGDLIDRSTDQHKRLGGLVSTGQNNVEGLNGIPSEYVCAEVDNEMVGSPIQDNLRTMMRDSELRTAYIRISTEDVHDSASRKNRIETIDKMSIEEIETNLKDERPDLYDTLVKNAEKKANDFVSDIDVADGAAYITDEMAEWLLRMVGSWDKKVERAFKILRGEEVDGKRYTINDIRELSLAYADVLTTVIGNQKYTAYGFRYANNIAAAYYDKMALFPMFRTIATGPSAKIFQKMKNEGVHMLLINSAVKVGSQGSQPMTMSDFRQDNDPSNEANFKSGDVGQQDWKPSFEEDFHFNTYKQRFKYLRKQFNTDPKESATTKMGTQMTKVAMANLILERDYVIVEGVDENGNKIYRTSSGRDLRDDVMTCINEMSNIGERKIRLRFIVEKTTTGEDGKEVTTRSVNIKELSKFLREELASRGASQEAIEAVSLAVNKDSGELEMYIPPVAQNSLEWIQSIITSMINKNVIDINTPGGAFIQRSVWGMEGPTTVMNEEDLPSDIYEGRELQMINEEGTMDCVLSIDYFFDIIPQDVVRDEEGRIVYKVDESGQFLYNTETDENGNEIRKRIPETRPKSFKDARQWLIDNNIISGRKSNGQWNNATANTVASRIPTQAPSSIHALRCVDVLDVVRDTVILPKEFTKITGADFDIDKLFLSRFFYRKNGKSVSTTFEPGTTEYYANRLLNNYIALLKDSKSQEEENVNRTTSSNHASIDGDTKLLKDIIKDLEEGKKEEELDPFTPYSLWANASTKTEFITGKFGIGPFALNNNSQILTMLYGVKFKTGTFMDKLKARRLDLSMDRYGKPILSWLSGLINAHVDVAKDPYISRLNVNTYTYNLVNLMIRTGFGQDTFYFTTQPIMKQLAVAYQNAASQFGEQSGGSKYRRQTEACEKLMEDFIKTNFEMPSDVVKLEDMMKVLSGHFSKTLGISMDRAVEVLLSKDNDILHLISKKGIPAHGSARLFEIEDGIKLSAKEIQVLVYYAKTKFEPHERDLSRLVQYSKIDTKKQGKNIVEQMVYASGVADLFDLKNRKFGTFEDLTEYYMHSYIQNKTQNAIGLFQDIMSQFTIESTPLFQSQVRQILHVLRTNGESADTNKAISRLILNYIRAGFFNTWAEVNHIDVKGLVSGSNTISDRLADIRVKIMTDPAYADLLSEDGSIKNYLIASLVQGYQHEYKNRITALNVGTEPDTYPNVKFIKTLNFMDADHINEDDLTEAWDELLNDDTHKDIQEFARDLIMYAFITSGGNSGNNLFKFIPNSWKIDSYGNGDTIHGYAQYMQDQLDIYKGSSVNDSNMIDIDEIMLNSWYDNRFIPITRIDGWETYSTSKVGFDSSNKPYGIAVPVVIVNPNADIEKFSDDKYIKVRRECSDGESQRNFTIYKAVEYTADGKLIYAMVEPKGNQYKTGDTIYEMRRNDSKRKESAVFAAASKSLSTSIKIAKEAMGVQGTDLAQILEDVIQRIRSKESMPAREKMVNLFTIDPQLNEWIKSAIPIEDEIVDDSKFLKAARFYNREDVEKDDKTLYIFTDNTDRDSGGGLIDENSWYAKKYGTGHHYPGKTSAVIRGLENAAPISTQRWYHDGAKGETGRWTDEAFDEFKAVIDDEIEQIKSMWRSGKYNRVVYPDLFNSKISNITRERTPQIFEYLTTKIADLEDFINKGVESSRQEAEKTGAKTYKPTTTNFNKSTAEFYSGAARGSDTEWATIARQLGIKVKDFVGDDYRALSEEQRAEIEKEYNEARAFLGKPVLPIRDINNNNDSGVLTRRDMMQADKADAIFAIAERIVKSGESEISGGRSYTNNTGHDNVQGGTANAVARGIIRGIPVYVFDQSDNQWKVWNDNEKQFVVTQQPSITQHAAVIGTRQITDAGKQAIKDVYNFTFNASRKPYIKPEIGNGQQNSIILENGKEYSPDDILSVYKNNPANLAFFNLANVVFEKAKELGITFRVNNDITGSGVYHADEHVAEFNLDKLQLNTLLHEAIHSVINYLVHLAESNPQLLSKQQLAAVQELKFVYSTVKDDHFKGLGKLDIQLLMLEKENYGFSSFDEFIAELSNPEFRAKIKETDRRVNKNIFKTLIDAIANLLGIQKTYESLEKTAYLALKVLLENTNKNLFKIADKHYKFLRQYNNMEREHYVQFYIPRELEELFLAFVDEKHSGRTLKINKNKWDEVFSENDFNRIKQGRLMKINLSNGSVISKIDSDVRTNGEYIEIDYSVIAPEEYINYLIENGFVLDSLLPYKADLHGNYYGWSLESIRKHLYSYIVESTGYSAKEKFAHLKHVNKLYNTNFRAYKEKSGKWILLNNTRSKSELTLSDNPNIAKQLNFLDEELKFIGDERDMLIEQINSLELEKNELLKELIDSRLAKTSVVHINNDDFMHRGDIHIKAYYENGEGRIFMSNGKNVFGNVTVTFGISKNTIASNVLFPNNYIFKPDINFNRLPNVIKDNIRLMLISLLHALKDSGYTTLQSGWITYGSDINENIVVNNFLKLYGVSVKNIFIPETKTWIDEYAKEKWGLFYAKRASFKFNINIQRLLNVLEDENHSVVPQFYDAFKYAAAPTIGVAEKQKRLSDQIEQIGKKIEELYDELRTVNENLILRDLAYYGLKLKEKCQ